MFQGIPTYIQVGDVQQSRLRNWTLYICDIQNAFYTDIYKY